MQLINDLSSHLKGLFGERVFKVSLDAGFGCPNFEKGGCSFCLPESYSPLVVAKGIIEQLSQGIDYIKKRHQAGKFIAYFQAGSATNASTDLLRESWEQALSSKDVVGLAVSTRPDCLNEGVLRTLAGFKGRTKIMWLELGLQSASDRTLSSINRGHTVGDFVDAARMAMSFGIDVCAHVIIGLPQEGRADVLRTAKLISELKLWGVKIHNLHVVKGTALEKRYDEGRVTVLPLEEYARLAADFIEHLRWEILIHRVNAHAPRQLTTAPAWSVNKLGVMNAVMAELKRRGTRQGVVDTLQIS